MAGEKDKPTILIYHSLPEGSGVLKALCEGVEEEGLPWQALARGGDAVTMARDACQASRLSVGIGANDKELALQTDKLDPAKPLFCIPANSAPERVRALGSNAARLVKRMPFKPVD